MLPDLALQLTLITCSSNYLCLEHIFMVPKMFEPLKFDCISHRPDFKVVFSLPLHKDYVAKKLATKHDKREYCPLCGYI